MLFSLRSEFEFIYSYEYAHSKRFETDYPKKLFKFITRSECNTKGNVNGEGK